jgi:hypothetical protein
MSEFFLNEKNASKTRLKEAEKESGRVRCRVLSGPYFTS